MNSQWKVGVRGKLFPIYISNSLTLKKMMKLMKLNNFPGFED